MTDDDSRTVADATASEIVKTDGRRTVHRLTHPAEPGRIRYIATCLDCHTVRHIVNTGDWVHDHVCPETVTPAPF